MLRLIKYIKPYILLVILSIGLLFLLVNADLALPDYLSQIVNIGIQQNGIESGNPQAIRKSEFDKLTIFFDEQEQSLAENAYRMVDQDAEDFNELKEIYPALSNEPIYVLKDLEKAELDSLEPIMSKGMMILYAINQMIENPEQAGEMMGELPIDLAQLPDGMDPFALLRMAPEAQMAQIRDQITQQFDQMEETFLNRITTASIKAEYQALGMDLGGLQTNYILRVGGMMILFSLIAGIANISVSFLAARTSAGVARDIRKDVFTKVESFSSQEFNNFSTASLITRATNDVTQIQQVVFMIIRMAFYAPILGIGSVIRAVDKSPNMWWIIALSVVILLLIIAVIMIIATPKFMLIQKLIDRLNLVTRENLTGMMVIRAFNKQKFEENRFDHANRELADNNLFINRLMVSIMPLMMLIMNGLQILIIWVGAHEIAQLALQVGDMMAFLQYSMQIMYSFLMMSMLFIFLPRSFVSGNRIAEILDTENVIQDPKDPKSFNEHLKGKVEFKNVYFRYPDAEEYVLKDISFTTMPMESTLGMSDSKTCAKKLVIPLSEASYSKERWNQIYALQTRTQRTKHYVNPWKSPRQLISFLPILKA